MDSEHRHELQENALAHWLERKIEAAQPHMPLILGGVIALVVGVWGYNLLRSSGESARTAAWDGYAISMEGPSPNLALLERVAEDQAGSEAASWAGITLADGKLYVASQSYLVNRETAAESLEDAKEIYSKLRGAGDARVRNRALFGLGRAAELEGDLDAAKDLYGQVKGAFGKVASRRVEELSTDRVIADFEWLATAKPAAVGRPAGPGIPGQTPDFEVDMIETPGGEEAPAEDVQSGASALDDILGGLDLQEEAEAEAAVESADLQPADETTESEAEAGE